jgi:hypothetical protein
MQHVWGVERQNGVSYIFGENELSIGIASRNTYPLQDIMVQVKFTIGITRDQRKSDSYSATHIASSSSSFS